MIIYRLLSADPIRNFDWLRQKLNSTLGTQTTRCTSRLYNRLLNCTNKISVCSGINRLNELQTILQQQQWTKTSMKRRISLNWQCHSLHCHQKMSCCCYLQVDARKPWVLQPHGFLKNLTRFFHAKQPPANTLRQ